MEKPITASENGGELSTEERRLYGESVGIELKEMISSAGYAVKDVRVSVDESGHVDGVILSFAGEVFSVSQIEEYIKRVFGEDIVITYE